MDKAIRDRLAAMRIIPVVALEDPASATGLGDALVAGGLPIIEVTLRTDTALGSLTTLAARGDLLVGAGTIVDPGQVDEVAGAGAEFVVSPGFSLEVARKCEALGIAYLPGVATPTEVMAAMATGFDTLKLFPAELLGGRAALRAFKGPFPNISFIPTGGISEARVPSYLQDPAVLAVGGSWMVPRELLAENRFSEIQDLAAAAAKMARETL